MEAIPKINEAYIKDRKRLTNLLNSFQKYYLTEVEPYLYPKLDMRPKKLSEFQNIIEEAYNSGTHLILTLPAGKVIIDPLLEPDWKNLQYLCCVRASGKDSILNDGKNIILYRDILNIEKI